MSLKRRMIARLMNSRLMISRLRDSRLRNFKLRNPRLWIQAFIIFHLTALFLCEFPGVSPVRRSISSGFRAYTQFFNLDQNWSMFAPEPSSLNAFIRAEVKYRDGTIQFLELPRMSEMGLLEKYFKERYRKWGMDYIRSDDYRHLWPATATYLARKAVHDPRNPPIEISLWRHWMIVESPREKFRKVHFRVPESEMQKFMFFKTEIKPSALL